jgi:hypothetical protein
MIYQTRRIVWARRLCVKLLILGLMTVRANISGCIAGDREELERFSSFETLLAKAGKPDRGLVMEARIQNGGTAPTPQVTIVLSIKNVLPRPNEFNLVDMRVTPEVFVRDKAGKPAAMTSKGADWYREPWYRRATFGSGSGYKLGPGQAIGSTYDLDKYFKLDKAGEYTVLLWTPDVTSAEDFGKNHDLLHSGVLVSRPLTIHIQDRAVVAGGKEEKQSQFTGPSKTGDGTEPRDKDWMSLALGAGKSIRGCILEATDSPVDSGKGNLIVSLVCLKAQDVSDGRTTLQVPEAEDLHVLVRDRLGHAIEPVVRVPERPPNDDRKYWTSLIPGDAIGIKNPLSELFHLKQPGEYWVLISLRSREKGVADWVAAPIKVRISAEQSGRKKEK